LACSAKDCHSTTNLSATLQQKTSSGKAHRKQTYRQRMVHGHDAGPQGLHILIILEDIILPRGVIPVNFPAR
jgi:hypothetical protein